MRCFPGRRGRAGLRQDRVSVHQKDAVLRIHDAQRAVQRRWSPERHFRRAIEISGQPAADIAAVAHAGRTAEARRDDERPHPVRHGSGEPR